MKPKLYFVAFGLAFILSSVPSAAESQEDAYAAYGRGDYSQALQIWKELAGHGSRAAQYHLGEMYSLGQGVSRNDQEAAKWYERAAASGYALAQSRLGAMYDEGRGIPQSLSKAMKWYRQAAQQGELTAQVTLGLIYGTGRGVPHNYFQALKWFGLAAEQGDALAQYNVGRIYASGYDVVPKDDVQALVWFIIAERGGNEDGRTSHEAFALKMSPDKIARAEKRAQDWMATKVQDKEIKCSLARATECN